MTTTNNYMAKCDNVIPAERCMVLVFQSIGEREAFCNAVPDRVGLIGAFRLENLNRVDELDCGWEGLIPMDELADGRGLFLRGECPACGQDITLREDG